MTSLGFLGAGHLTELLVRGVSGCGYRLIVSPRNAEVAARLSAEHGCDVAASNQALVDAVDGVFVCLPAATGAEVLAGLTFRPGQPVLSAMAGTGLAKLQAAFAKVPSVAPFGGGKLVSGRPVNGTDGPKPAASGR